MARNGDRTGLDQLNWTLRRSDQATVAALVLIALAILCGSWLVGGGSGGLVDIDRALPRPVVFKVRINEAEPTEIMLLPEIGETLAKRITASREREGPFRTTEDLQRVKGIGPVTAARIGRYITFD